MKCKRKITTARKLFVQASSTLLVNCSSAICKVSVYCSLHSRWYQHDSVSLLPTRATRKQRTKKLGRRYLPERSFRSLARYKLRCRLALFTYMCLSAQVSGRETRACTLVAGTKGVSLRFGCVSIKWTHSQYWHCDGLMSVAVWWTDNKQTCNWPTTNEKLVNKLFTNFCKIC